MSVNNTLSNYTLYSSEGCHLCELALDICMALITEEQLNVVDIVDEDKLVTLYGVHIPVLERMSDGEKLFWPFTAEQASTLFAL